MALRQTAYRGRNDDGTETTATWKAAVNTPWYQPSGTTFRVRWAVLNDAASTSSDWQTMYRRNGGSWIPITGSSAVARAALSTNVADNDVTTQQISSGTFTAGSISETDGYYGSTTLGLNTYTELEQALTIVAGDVIDGDVVDLAVHRGNWAALDAFDVTCTLTVGTGPIDPVEPALATTGAFSETWESLPVDTHIDGETIGDKWFVRYAGVGGTVRVKQLADGNKVLEEEAGIGPHSDPEWGDTSSSLVTSVSEWSTETALDVTVNMRTIRQVTLDRNPPLTPDNWEVAWFVWNYSEVLVNGETKRRFYYITLKPTGVELGKVDQTTTFPGGQRFLWTQNTPTYPAGTTWRQIRVLHEGNRIRVYDQRASELIADFTDGPGSGGTPAWGTAGETVFTEGNIGFYHEDAQVQFGTVNVVQSPVGGWVFRLTVTDDDGATNSVLVSVPVEETASGPVLPWLGVGAVRPWVGAGSDTWRGVARV